jgi:hypothetical protein
MGWDERSNRREAEPSRGGVSMRIVPESWRVARSSPLEEGECEPLALRLDASGRCPEKSRAMVCLRLLRLEPRLSQDQKRNRD